MKRLFFLALLLFMVGANSVIAQEVTYNYDQGADFSKFKTYKWVSIKNAEQVDDITARQITAAIDSELAKKGLPRPTRTTPIFILATKPPSEPRSSGMRSTPVGDMVRVGAAVE
jgi:Domain of unknown function (DUF4136)